MTDSLPAKGLPSDVAALRAEWDRTASMTRPEILAFVERLLAALSQASESVPSAELHVGTDFQRSVAHMLATQAAELRARADDLDVQREAVIAEARVVPRSEPSPDHEKELVLERLERIRHDAQVAMDALRAVDGNEWQRMKETYPVDRLPAGGEGGLQRRVWDLERFVNAVRADAATRDVVRDAAERLMAVDCLPADGEWVPPTSA